MILVKVHIGRHQGQLWSLLKVKLAIHGSNPMLKSDLAISVTQWSIFIDVSYRYYSSFIFYTASSLTVDFDRPVGRKGV